MARSIGMKVLVVGEAAREHAIAERLAADSDVYAVMRKHNPGIARLAKAHWVCDNTQPEEVVRAISGQTFDLAFVSPDALLAAGISDVLAAHGIPVASPTKVAARIEWDKGFMRSLMDQYQIPGRIEHTIVANEHDALRAIKKFGKVAIKPLGLTGGKGVKVSGDHFTTEAQAMEYVRELLRKDGRLLLEEKLVGEEFSFQAFSDGTRIATMPPVQDNKRAYANDAGANTGGMGSYSTGRNLPFLSDSDLEQATTILQKTIDALRKEGTLFVGVLYGQFMAVRDGVRVVEFNARFGDPEAMNVLSLLDGSLRQTLASMAAGQLHTPAFRTDCTVVKYLVPEGYPDSPAGDSPISIDGPALKKSGARVYFASVYEKEGIVYTTRSRGVAVVGVAPTLAEAEQKAESGCRAVHGALRHRSDIGTASLVQKRIDRMKELRG